MNKLLFLSLLLAGMSASGQTHTKTGHLTAIHKYLSQHGNLYVRKLDSSGNNFSILISSYLGYFKCACLQNNCILHVLISPDTPWVADSIKFDLIKNNIHFSMDESARFTDMHDHVGEGGPPGPAIKIEWYKFYLPKHLYNL